MIRLNKQRVIYGALLICWMIFIFFMSAQHAEKSSQMSGGLVSKIIAVIYPEFDVLPQIQQQTLIHTTTFIVRKAAHFFEYFVLGALAILTAYTFKKYKFLIRFLAAIIFCVLYAVSDEIHQLFVPGRACKFGDVLIDSTGILIAIIIISVALCRKKSGEGNAKKETD